MIIKAKRPIPAYEHEYIAKIVCDMCGNEAPDPEHHYPWADSSYEYEDVKVEYTEGTSYPGDCYGTTYVFDVCPSCWKKKLVPYIESFGQQARKVEW